MNPMQHKPLSIGAMIPALFFLGYGLLNLSLFLISWSIVMWATAYGLLHYYRVCFIPFQLEASKKQFRNISIASFLLLFLFYIATFLNVPSAYAIAFLWAIATNAVVYTLVAYHTYLTTNEIDETVED